MENLSDILNVTKETAYLPKEDEFLKDGIVYCKKCKTARQAVSPDGKHKVNCLCKCQKEEYLQEKKQAEEQQRLKIIENLKETSLIGERYKNVTFNNTKIGYSDSFDTAYKRCMKYCTVSERALENGWGIYLYGEKGVGKSHLTACIANELISQMRQVLFTNFTEIARKLRTNFKDIDEESDFIIKLSNIDFLIIDDLGVERVQTKDGDLWLQEKIFEVLNKRYNNKAPTIFTSNYSPKELIDSRGIAGRTVDRIIEMSNAIIKIEGINYRKKLREEVPF